MRKYIFFILASLSLLNSTFAQTYYVQAGANDTNTLGNITSPLSTIQKAVDLAVDGEGCTIYVMDGVVVDGKETTYGRTVINKSGNSSKYITITNLQNHTPIIKPTTTDWEGISVDRGSAFVKINGLELIGNNNLCTLESSAIDPMGALNQPRGCRNPFFSGDGGPKALYNINAIDIDAGSPFGSTKIRQHHIEISNCIIHDFGGAGLNAIKVDYITFKDNLVYNNSWYTVYGGSGINIYQPYDSDTNITTYRNIIEGNISHSNELKVPWGPSVNTITGEIGTCKGFTDGNGIILDDFQQTQQPAATRINYSGKTLVQNNVCYNNGGSGIHSFRSDNVDILNNTAYKNSTTEFLRDGEVLDNGEIFAYQTNNVKIINNILYAEETQKINSNNGLGNTNFTYLNNLHYSGKTLIVTNGTCINKNPEFVNEALFDFRLKGTSPAINKGTTTLSVSNDILKTVRDSLPDIGAYENTSPINPVNNPFSPGNLVVSSTGISKIGIGGTGLATSLEIREFDTTSTLQKGSRPRPLGFVIDDRLISHEGQLQLSSDRKYILAIGRETAVGTTSINTRLKTTPVIVARIDSNNTIEKTILTGNDFEAQGVRSIASPDGISFYIATGGSLTGTKLAYHLGTSTTKINSEITRSISVFGQNLVYVTSNNTIKFNIGLSNTALPISSLTLSNSNSQLTNISQIVLFDTDPNRNGIGEYDLMYLANRDKGIAKYNYVAGTTNQWVFQGIVNTGDTNYGFCSMSGRLENNKPILYGIKINTNENYSELYRIEDVTLSEFNWEASLNNPVYTKLAVSGWGEIFRGVTFTPEESTFSINDNIISLNSISITPNPSNKNGFNISSQTEITNIEIEVFTSVGQKIYSKKGITSNETIDLNDIQSAGVYIVRLKSEGKIVTKKWILK